MSLNFRFATLKQSLRAFLIVVTLCVLFLFLLFWKPHENQLSTFDSAHVAKSWLAQPTIVPKIEFQYRSKFPPIARPATKSELTITNASPITNQTFHCNVYNQSVPKLSTKGFTKYSLRSPATSAMLVIHAYSGKDLISRSLTKYRSWEFHIVKSIDRLLSKDTDLGLIDLGCNVGVYTLSAASRGTKVVALDANLDNIMRVRQSVTDNGFIDRVTLLHNALYNKRETVYLKLIPNNIGGSELSDKSQATQNTAVQSILMNDLLEVIPFKKAIMKIDIQMREYHAFQHAEMLFDRMNITHVYIEWMYRSYPQNRYHYDYIRKFFIDRNYSPYGDPNNLNNPLSSDMKSWPKECVIWKKN